MQTFSISQLAEEFGITPRAIRFYEDEELIKPVRQGQSRIYSPRDRVRLALTVGQAGGVFAGRDQGNRC